MGWRANRLNQDRLQIAYPDPPAISLASLEIEEGPGGFAQARVYVPDSRMRVKVSVYYDLDPTFTPPFPPDLTVLGATLWIGEEEEGAGSFASYIPCQNVLRNPSTGAVITRAAPLSIPQDSKLLGYSQEFVTAADALFVEVGTGSAASPGTFGRWMLSARWQPDGQRLSEEEWLLIKPACKLQLLQSVST